MYRDLRNRGTAFNGLIATAPAEGFSTALARKRIDVMRKPERTKKRSTPNHPMLAIGPHGVMCGPIEWKTKMERTASPLGPSRARMWCCG
jgi:hypothetical protein